MKACFSWTSSSVCFASFFCGRKPIKGKYVIRQSGIDQRRHKKRWARGNVSTSICCSKHFLSSKIGIKYRVFPSEINAMVFFFEFFNDFFPHPHTHWIYDVQCIWWWYYNDAVKQMRCVSSAKIRSASLTNAAPEGNIFKTPMGVWYDVSFPATSGIYNLAMEWSMGSGLIRNFNLSMIGLASSFYRLLLQFFSTRLRIRFNT